MLCAGVCQEQKEAYETVDTGIQQVKKMGEKAYEQVCDGEYNM